MKKVLFVCNEGMSTSVLAQKVSDYAQTQEVSFTVDAKPESELVRCYQDYDLVMVAPQLAYMANKIAKRFEGEIKVGKLNPMAFGRMNVELLYAGIKEELENECN